MSFLSLPPEIHQRIISYLLSARDVAALSIQCRALHSMCEMPTRKIYDKISVYSNDESLDATFGLLMNILKRPTLGRYVHHIEVCSATSWHMAFKETEPRRGLSEEDTALVREAVRKTGFSGSDENRIMNILMQKLVYARSPIFQYQAALGSFISQALVAILVVFSPNLTSMATPQPFFHHDEKETYPLVDFLRRTNASSDTTPYFQNLRKIYLINKSDSCWSDGRFYVKMDLLGCWELFDQLPSIEYIGIDLLDWDDNGKQALDPRRSNFSKIAIHHSRVGSNGLIQMITSCKVLKEFQYSIGGRASNDGGNPLVNAKAIIKAILGHKETLETLDIDVDDRLHHMEGVTGDEEEYEDMEDDLDQYGGPLEHYLEDSVLGTLRSIWVRTGSLKDLGSLKKLSLGFIFLLYCATGVSATRPAPKRGKIPLVADCLPESLEYLCIRGYEKGENEEFDRQADALMALYESGSSNLKSLKGITEKIPNAENVDDPDGEYHLLWSLTERGYESD